MATQKKPDPAKGTEVLEPDVIETKTEGDSSLDERVNRRIYRNMTYAAGIGLIPIPVVDVVGLTALQIKLVRDIAKDHGNGSPELYSDKRIKVILTSLLSGIGPTLVGTGLAKGVRVIPFVGPIVGFVMMPAFSAAATYAVGKIFHEHFTSGEDITTFNVKEHWSNFKTFFREGRSQTKKMVGSFN